MPELMSVAVQKACGEVHTLAALVVLESLKASKGSTSSDQLMAEAGLVLLEVVVVVDLVVRVLAVICWMGRSAMPMDEVLIVDVPQKPIVSVCVALSLVRKWCVSGRKADFSRCVCKGECVDERWSTAGGSSP